MDAIRIRNLNKSYTSETTEVIVNGQRPSAITRQVLFDLSIDFPLGKITVILGRSGCGKSTLLRILEGRERADSGEIELCAPRPSGTPAPDPETAG